MYRIQEVTGKNKIKNSKMEEIKSMWQWQLVNIN